MHRVAHALGIRTQLHDALRPRRDVSRTASRISACCAICRTRRAASSPTSRSRITPTTTSWVSTLDRTGIATTGFDDLQEPRRRPALPRQLRAHQVALDHGHAVRVADVAALRRQRSRGHRRAREDLSRGRRAHRAGDDARRDPAAHSRRARRCPPSAIRSTTSSARSTTSPPPRRGGVTSCASDAFRTSTAIRSTARSIAASSPLDGELVDGVPTRAESRRWRAGTLDVSVISAVEYARDATRYLLLPDLAISCDGPVRSVMLFSQACRRRELHGRRVLVSRSSMTSVALLELLFENVWDAQARRSLPSDAEIVRRRARSARRSTTRGSSSATRRCISGRVCGRRSSPATTRCRSIRSRTTSAPTWKEWTGLPFVFAVWVAQRTAPVAEALAVHASLIASRDWGLAASRRPRRAGRAGDGRPRSRCALEYLSGLDYGLSYEHLAGLTEFFRRLVAAGTVPERVARLPSGGMTRPHDPMPTTMKDLLDFYTNASAPRARRRGRSGAPREASGRHRHVHRRPQHQLHERLRRRLRLLRVLSPARSTAKAGRCRTSRSAPRSTRRRRSAACRSSCRAGTIRTSRSSGISICCGTSRRYHPIHIHGFSPSEVDFFAKTVPHGRARRHPRAA